MKKYFKFLPYLFFGLCFILNSCSNDTDVATSNPNEIAKSSGNNISNILESLDVAVQAKSVDTGLTDEELSTIFMNHLESINGEIVEIDVTQSNMNSMELSDDYWTIATQIQNTSYNSATDYKNALSNLSNSLSNYDLTVSEFDIANGNIQFMIAFVNYMEGLSLQKSALIAKSGDCDGWWSCWGRCVAGIIGGALTGGVAGCAAIGGVGAAIGAAVTIWSGPGAAGGAGVGAAAGCIIGGVAGTIGGALTGAATFCD